MAKNMKKGGLTQKQVGGIVAGAGVFLLGGIVWAATSGVLTFGGTINRSGEVDLDIINQSCAVGVDAADCSVSVSADKNNLTFEVELEKPGATQDITFCVENVGTLGATLANMSVPSITGGTGVNITMPTNLNGVTLLPGETTCTTMSTISVEWDAAETSDTTTVEFTATINYAQASN
ncbi:hypothetical protein FWG76_02825 [Candidatus Saccharibacteria bacterium]|nr:hypothetical protein [Candidatus Saccharibacteria bacterium]